MAVPQVVQVYDGSWSVTDTYSQTPPANQMLNITVNGITGGNWMFCFTGWHAVTQLPTTVAVGDDAGNYWVPLASSPPVVAPTVFLLNQNYSFQNGVTAPWTVSNGTLTAVNTKSYGNNPYSGKVVNNGTSNTVSTTSGNVSISGFTSGLVSGSAYLWFTNSVTTARVDINWYNSSGSLLSTTTGANNTIPAQSWTNVTTLAAPVASAVTASINIAVSGSSPPAAGNVWYISNAGVSQPRVLNQNPYFTTTPALTGWTGTNGTFSSSTAQMYNTFPSVRITPNGTSSSVTLRTDTSHLVSVVPNQFYAASGYLYCPTGINFTAAEILWYNSSLTNISTSIGSPYTYIPPGEWTQVTNLAQAPTGAAFASVGVGAFNRPNAWDFFYAAQVTLNKTQGWSSTAQCSIWAAPNVSPSTTQVSVSPLGQVTALASIVWQVNNMPTWLTTDTLAATFTNESSTTSLTLTPSQADFVVSMAAAERSQQWTTDYAHIGGWDLSYSASWGTTNNTTVEGDVYIKVAAQPATSGASTPLFYSINPLNNNPVFAASVTGWTATNATLSSITGFTNPSVYHADTRLTTNNCALVKPAGGFSALNMYANLATAPAVTPGLDYTVEGYFFSPPGWTSNVLAIQWLNGSRTLLSTAVSSNFTLGSSAWANTSFTAVAPPGAAFATPTFGQNGSPPTSATTYVGRLTLTQANNNLLDLSQTIVGLQLNPQAPAIVNPLWPYLKLEAAFGYPSSTPPDQLQYVDISTRLLSVNLQRGRQYELNSLQAGTANFVLRNDDGYLTPSNTQSPYTIQAYTPIRLTAIWQGKSYPVFVGYMERWPEVWSDPHWGEVNAVGVDAWAMFVGIMPSIVKGERLIDGPAGYWPCGDGNSSSTAINIGVMGNSTPLQVVQAASGPGAGTQAFGDSSIKLVGDSGTNWALSGLLSSQGSQGFSLTYSGVPLPPTDVGVTVTWWMKVPYTGPVTTAARSAIFTATGPTGPIIQVWMDNGAGIHVSTWNVNTGVRTDHAPSSAAGWADQVVPMSLIFFDTEYTLYIGNSEILTGADTMANIWNQFSFCGQTDNFTNDFYTNMAISHIAVYPRMLGFSRIVTYNFTGINGMANDYGDWRVSRFLSYMLWTVPHRVYYDALTGLLGGATGIEGQNIGAAIGNVADTERALLYIDKAGYMVYKTRNHILDRGVQATFGENTAAGELPYLIDVELDYDPQYVYNDIQVTHQGTPEFGSTTTSSPVIYVKELSSINQYGDRSQQLTSLFNQVTQSVDLANWMGNQYAQPKARVQQIKFTPGRLPTLFNTLLQLDIGDRVIFNRRPVGANSITLDVIIIGVHHDIDWSSNNWVVTFDLMPTAVATLTLMSLTLNDPVLGQLDAGNVFNW